MKKNAAITVDVNIKDCLRIFPRKSLCSGSSPTMFVLCFRFMQKMTLTRIMPIKTFEFEKAGKQRSFVPCTIRVAMPIAMVVAREMQAPVDTYSTWNIGPFFDNTMILMRRMAKSVFRWHLHRLKNVTQCKMAMINLFLSLFVPLIQKNKYTARFLL
jgi:hypothetical protein